MSGAATSPRYFFETPAATGLADLFEQIRRRLVSDVFATLEITGTVPEDLALVPDSWEPATADVAPDGRSLVWRFDRPPATGVTVGWRVRPLEVGRASVGVSRFGLGPLGRAPTMEVDFDEPHVLVLAPRELATATPGGIPGATETPTATSTPIASATAPTPTKTPRGIELFFPIALRNVVWR